MAFLEEILAHKRREVQRLQQLRPLSEVQASARAVVPPLDFIAALHKRRGRPPASPELPALIAEVKCASPSKGLLVKDFDPLYLAQVYQQNGAAAISVLTDEHFFKGRLDYLRRIAAQPNRLPLLRKDFILDPYQVFEAREAGADAILLIVACLDESRLRELQQIAAKLGMTVLVEVHNRDELQVALAVAPKLIGINNRDLQSFSTSLQTTFELAPLVPDGVTLVAESGIQNQADVVRLAEAGITAVLVGEALVTASDIPAKVRSLT